MSTGALSEEARLSLKDEIKSTLMEILPLIIKEMVPVLPVIIEEMTPVVTEIVKEITPVVLDSTKDFYKNQTHLLQETKEAANLQHAQIFASFRRRHNLEFNQLMEERSKYYQRSAALGWQLDLYEQYLSEEDKEKMYIPKVFRKDDYFVHDYEELASVKKFEEQRFRSELEIMTKRKNFMMEEISKIDEKARKIVTDKNLPEEVGTMAINRWYQFADEYLKPIEVAEKKKRETTITAHQKDKAFYIKHQVERVKNKRVNEATKKMDTRSGEVAPLAPANGNVSSITDVGIEMPELEDIVPGDVASPRDQSNLVNMSTLDPIQLPEDLSQQSKNLQGKGERRKSPRTSSTYPVKT